MNEKIDLTHEWVSVLKRKFDNKEDSSTYRKNAIIYSTGEKYYVQSQITKKFLFFIPSYSFITRFEDDEHRYKIFGGRSDPCRISAVLEYNYGINGLVLNKEDVKNDYQYFNCLTLGEFDISVLKILEVVNEYFPSYPIISLYNDDFDEHLLYGKKS